jgi:hypothetical protein
MPTEMQETSYPELLKGMEHLEALTGLGSNNDKKYEYRVDIFY